MGSGWVTCEPPARRDAERCAGFAEGLAAPFFGRHGAGVGDERQGFVVGRCAAAVAAWLGWALVPESVDVQGVVDAL